MSTESKFPTAEDVTRAIGIERTPYLLAKKRMEEYEAASLGIRNLERKWLLDGEKSATLRQRVAMRRFEEQVVGGLHSAAENLKKGIETGALRPPLPQPLAEIIVKIAEADTEDFRDEQNLIVAEFAVTAALDHGFYGR